MAILFSEKIFDSGITQSSAGYISPDFYQRIAQGERFFFQIRASQVSGQTLPTLTVYLDQSNNGVEWFNRIAVVNSYTLSFTSSSTIFAYTTDLTSYPGAAYMRVGAVIGGTAAQCNIQIWLTVRSSA